MISCIAHPLTVVCLHVTAIAACNITCTDNAGRLQCRLRQHSCTHYCSARRHKRCYCRHLLTACHCSVQHHDVAKTDSQQTMRCLHYHDTSQQKVPANYWRAGAHTDFDTLTLLFQRPGKAINELSIITCFAFRSSNCVTLTC